MHTLLAFTVNKPVLLLELSLQALLEISTKEHYIVLNLWCTVLLFVIAIALMKDFVEKSIVCIISLLNMG